MIAYDFRDPCQPPSAWSETPDAPCEPERGYSDEEIRAERERADEWRAAMDDINDAARREHWARVTYLALRHAERVFCLKGGYLPGR